MTYRDFVFPSRPEDNQFMFSGQAGQKFTLDRSTDLLNWTILAPAINAGPEPWEARNVWAPHVIPTPDSPGHWTMFYTGT